MTDEWLPTACILCECNCGIVVQTEGRTLAKIRGDKDHPGTLGYTCNKALRLDHYQNSRTRLTAPMRRRPDGSYEEIGWDTAISEIAEGFTAIRDAHGGDKIFYYGGGGQGNHLGGAYSGAFLKAIGSRYRSTAGVLHGHRQQSDPRQDHALRALRKPSGPPCPTDWPALRHCGAWRRRRS